MINNCTFMGRLTAKPELRATQSGLSVTAFSIAVDRAAKSKDGNRITDFINVVAWRSTAEFICKYFDKGQMIAITGELQSRSYKDNAGNSRTAYEINVNSVSFCGDSKKDSTEPFSEPMQAADNEELPWN